MLVSRYRERMNSTLSTNVFGVLRPTLPVVAWLGSSAGDVCAFLVSESELIASQLGFGGRNAMPPWSPNPFRLCLEKRSAMIMVAPTAARASSHASAPPFSNDRTGRRRKALGSTNFYVGSALDVPIKRLLPR